MAQLTERQALRDNSRGSERVEGYRIDMRLLADLASEEEKTEFANLFRQSKRMRDALIRVLTGEYARVTMQLESGKHLESVNALAVLTDLYAYQRGLRFATKLLTQEQS